MIRGLYTSATGLNAGSRQQDVISNNLANANTPGYKRQDTVFQSLLERQIWSFQPDARPSYIGQLGTGSNFRLSTEDSTLGQIIPSSSNLDIALTNPAAYLAVEQNGNTAYSRNGQLQVDEQGYLRQTSGAYVLGMQNPLDNYRIKVSDPDQLVITSAGTLQDRNGQTIDRLQLAQFDPTAQLTHMGDSLVNSDKPALAMTNPGIKQSSLEQANVQVVKEMVNLIATMRYYETNTKMIQIQDQTLDKAVNEVGRI